METSTQLLSFFCFHQTHDYYACVFAVCGCVGVFVGVCVCGCGMLICFVNALGSQEMGRHKLPIIIIIIVTSVIGHRCNDENDDDTDFDVAGC